MNKLLALAAIAAAATAAFAAEKKAEPRAEKGGDLYAVFDTTAGKIVVKLLPDKTPKAVENFVGLAEGKKAWTDPNTGKQVKEPLYDGTLFHRVIPGFMIQGGDPLTRGAAPGSTATPEGRPYGTGDPGYKIEDELDLGERPYEQPCQLAYANSGPNTNGSQFFITEGAGDQVPQLEPRACSRSPSGVCGYVRFGTGVCGCERVRPIAEAGNSRTVLKHVKIVRGKAPSCN